MATHSNVLYIEPNYTNSGINIIDENKNPLNKHVEFSPNLEDYCITVDLEVEITERSNGSCSETDSKTLLFSWSSTNGTVSFNSGKDFTYTSSGGKTKSSLNWLSTEPTDFGTYEDMVQHGTHECFGINSIDISYNNYAVPEVTIQFTDIRGMSLFGQEELRHRGVSSDGASGLADTDIAGSFFKCFFTFPYPKFRLMVKGFYGEPASYELCCADFRANFECQTGNFGATARFVGYSYSLLNDITMNALVAAPYCEYVGAKYWEKMKKTKFIVDHKEMPTFLDIISKIKNIKEDISRISNDNEIAIKAKKLDDEGKYIDAIERDFEDYYIALLDKLKELKLNGDDKNPIPHNGTKSFLLLNTVDKIDEKSFSFTDLNEKYSRLESTIKDYNNNFPNAIQVPPSFNKFTFIPLSNDNLQESLQKSPYKNILGTFEAMGYKYAQFYDNSSFVTILNDLNKTNKNNVEDAQQKLAEETDKVINQHLGFQPTVENITSILMAHLDTLIHCIYACGSEVGSRERTPSSLGMNTSDVKFNNSKVPPFPRIDTAITESGITKTVNGWLGDMLDGYNQPEVNLVEGLLEATNKIADKMNEVVSELKEVDGYTNEINLNMRIPLTPLDIVVNEKPFGKNIDFNVISDFIGKLGIRMFNIFGTNDVCNDISKMGAADAINFINDFPNPNSTFKEKIINGVIKSNDIINALLNVNNKDIKQLKINENYWKWDLHNDVASVNFIKKVGSNYQLNLYKVGNTQLLPIKNIEWDNIQKQLGNGQLPNGDDFLRDKYELSNSENNILFKIDKQYTIYPLYESSMKVNGENFKYVDDLGIKYDIEDYCDDYFIDDVRFCKTFRASSDKNITFACEENTYLLPPFLPTNEQARNSKAFSSGKGITDFSTIKNHDGSTSETIKRNKETSVASEINYVNTFTYTSFYGIKNGNLTEDYSLFGQEEYYNQSPKNYGKALLFLETLKAYDSAWYDFKRSDWGGFHFEKVVDDLLNNKKHFNLVPYCAVLLIGAYLYRYEQDDEIIYFHENLVPRTKTQTIIHGENIWGNLFKLQHPIKNALIKEFIEWVENDFKKYQQAFEIKTVNNTLTSDFITEIGEILHNCNYNFKTVCDYKPLNDKGIFNIETYLSQRLSHTFYENYISFVGNEKKLKLWNRETSIVLNDFVNQYVKPCMLIKTTNLNLIDNTKTFNVLKSKMSIYLDSFLNELKKQYESDKKESSGVPNVKPVETDKNIKIELYRYLKVLWDKWLSGNNEDYWSYSNFYVPNWYFIDSFYNKIGQKAKLNIINFSSDIIYSQREHSYSLLSFISKAYATNQFGFYTVQNFMDICSGDTAVNNMKNLFKPIPYEKIMYPEKKFHPSFIIMYTYEYSSKLNMDDGYYNNDSFDIATEMYDELPKPITTKTEATGYKIPAFGVSYGKQYQSYFKDISVSMDSPMVTEHALKAQFEIATMHGNKGENGKNVTVLGQDLYTIYANNSYTCTVKMMGCAWIQPLMCFNLLNIPLFRGTYLIQKVQHRIVPGNMETTFIGTRMSATSQHFVEKCFVSKQNNEVAPFESKETVEHQIADVTNNCEYKFFNPLVNCEPPLSEEELNMTVGEFIKKYNFTSTDHVLDSVMNSKMLNFFAGVAQKEANNQNQLGVDLVVTVLFNRFMHYGKDLTKMFKPKQHEVGTSTDEKFVSSVQKIFTNYPIILKGETTRINRSIPIMDNGKQNGMTTPKQLTEHDLKAMDGYCTTNGYDTSRPKGENEEPKDGWWQTKSEYLAQHDTAERAPGHVFVGGFDGTIGKEHWTEVPIKTKSVDSKTSDLAEGLFNAIKQTINTSRVINIENLTLEESNVNKDSFFITCSPLSGLVNVFDIIVTTYYDYVKEVGWLVKNDGKEYPYKIKVVSKNQDNGTENGKIIAIGKLGSGEKLIPLNQYENLNENFYKTLKKKYGNSISNLNQIDFKNDCKNFNGLIIKQPKDWQNTVNNILGLHELLSCGNSVNTVMSDGYSWDGDNSISNQYKPSGKITSYNIDDVVSTLVSNSTKEIGDGDIIVGSKSDTKSLHRCAKYVRIAMQKGGGNSVKIINDSRPESACVYSKFLPTWGFSEVYSGFGAELNGFIPQKGDIAVIAGTSERQHGHIQIYDGSKYWISDYKDTKPWCYSDEGRPFKIFRWQG